jgi:hypothetical protein
MEKLVVAAAVFAFHKHRGQSAAAIPDQCPVAVGADHHRILTINLCRELQHSDLLFFHATP